MQELPGPAQALSRYNMSGIVFCGGTMDQPSLLQVSRRNEDIALDLMKFIAGTTGYGKPLSTAAGFQGGTESKSEDYAAHLLELYTRCLQTVNGKK
jgi:hypothetical protein